MTAFVYGTPTPADHARVEQLRLTADGRRLLAELDAEARLGGAARPRTDVAHLRRRAESIVNGREPATAHGRADHGVLRHVLPPRRTAWRWTATLGAAVGVMVLVAKLIGTHGAQPSFKTYTTTAAQVATITLGDGSEIRLAPRSSLIVPTDVAGVPRTVELRGEASFDVRPSAQRAFIVRAGAVSARVLGTSFDVQAYPADGERVRVTVAAGKVAVQRAGDGRVRAAAFTLSAGMTGALDDSTASVVADGDVGGAITWTRDAFVFREAPLRDVLATFGHWYGMTLRVSDSAMMQWHLNGTLDFKNREQALQSLQQMLNVGLTFDDSPGHEPVAILVRRAPAHGPRGKTETERSLTLPRTEVGR